ncbi:MAG: VOC family protein [Pseudomonadales bacterium]|nr:VOC family protein [Pseudomonadales bacterium]
MSGQATDVVAPVVRAEMLIRAPIARVFQAFVDPGVTTQFWFSHSSGPVVAGARLSWRWEDYGAEAEVDVLRLEPERSILIAWPTPVEWRFAPAGAEATFVEIRADGFTGTPAEITAQALDSMGGFTMVLAACKAWLEHGIRLELVRDRAPHAHVRPLADRPSADVRIRFAAPQLLVNDLGQALDYYERKLGFEREFVYEGFYAAVRRDGAVIHLKCAPTPEGVRARRKAEEHLDAFVEVSDVVALYEEIAARGARIAMTLGERAWGAVDFQAEDVDGHVLCFSGVR